MALAVVLNVHPAALLLPPTARDTDRVTGKQVTVSVTAAGEVPARAAWQWAHGMRGLTLADGESEWENWHRFADSALPDGWEGMSVRQYEEWRAEQARQKYEHILEQTGFNPDGTRREGSSGG
ncbi:hypothetical protein [Streptomyces sp. NPDC058155]|uniref:hypothetical protein n=1 Tax=Streptomyces sp. NPDC058155 TaxID=3346359 RepID=UPI0036F02358